MRGRAGVYIRLVGFCIGGRVISWQVGLPHTYVWRTFVVGCFCVCCFFVGFFCLVADCISNLIQNQLCIYMSVCICVNVFYSRLYEDMLYLLFVSRNLSWKWTVAKLLSIPISICLLFYVLTIIKIISGWVPTCDGVHTWRLYSATQLRDQTADTMTRYPTQSHYPDNVLTSPCPILLMQSARLGINFMSLVWLGWDQTITSMGYRYSKVCWFLTKDWNCDPTCQVVATAYTPEMIQGWAQRHFCC